MFAPPQYVDTPSGEHYSPIPFEVLEALKGSLKEIAAKLPPKGKRMTRPAVSLPA